MYGFPPIQRYKYTVLSFPGNAGAHATVRSNPAGAHGYFSTGGTNTNVGYTATYADFLRIGDAVTHGFENYYEGTALTSWNVTHSTFSDCGSVYSTSDSGVQ